MRSRFASQSSNVKLKSGCSAWTNLGLFFLLPGVLALPALHEPSSMLLAPLCYKRRSDHHAFCGAYYPSQTADADRGRYLAVPTHKPSIQVRSLLIPFDSVGLFVPQLLHTLFVKNSFSTGKSLPESPANGSFRTRLAMGRCSSSSLSLAVACGSTPRNRLLSSGYPDWFRR